MGKVMGSRRLLTCLATAGLIALAAVVVPTPALATQRAMRVDTVVPPPVPGAVGSATGLISQFAQGDVAPFEMLGASWGSAPPGQARVRVRKGGRWGAWTALETEAEDGPDRGSHEARPGRVVSRPVWVGSADGYELQAAAGGLQVHLVRQAGAQIRLRAGGRAEGAAAPPVANRGAWGARAPRRSAGVASKLKMAFVHHSTTSNGYGPNDVARMIRGMQAYHMDANGWDDIGYNFLVDRFGRIWEGRAGSGDRPVIGSHTQGFNTASTGVAVIGTFTRSDPPAAAVDGVARVTGWQLGKYGVDPGGTTTMTSAGNDKYRAGRNVGLPTISGHSDGKATACPGRRLYLRLPAIRASARSYAAGTALVPGLPSLPLPIP